MAQANPFEHIKKELAGHGRKYFSLAALNDPRVEKLPYSIRILLESALRNCDEFEITKADVENILNWEKTAPAQTEVPFKPARVILQDFTGVPCVVDLAAMRDAMARLGGDATKINPLVPVDLVIDHSVQVDASRSKDALDTNQRIEFERNKERFAFLKWGATAFQNMLIVPPGSGIVHQVNLEYLARVAFDTDGLMYPDSVVGTDSHTTMVDGLGVAGWGVGGIEAEAVMLGQPVSMVLPEVVGFKLTSALPPAATATDLVLTVTAMLRKRGVVGKFVEFFGPGVASLSLADRATIANMAPEYGATMGFFCVDDRTLEYLRQTGRPEERVLQIEAYCRANMLFNDGKAAQPTYSGDLMSLDLSTVVPCMSGPKRPHDHVKLSDMKQDFQACLTNKVGFKGFGLANDAMSKGGKFTFKGQSYELKQGSVVISSITSCTNTSNPGVLLAAGMLAKNAVAKGLAVRPYIKTSLSPGSQVVTDYLKMAGLTESLEALGFHLAGYGCMTCIGNSGDLDEEVAEAVSKNELVVAAVLSGNRNFEGRVHPLTQANYLASPPLCVAYALAGTVNIDFESEPLGKDKEGKDVFLRDIWPSSSEIRVLEQEVVKPDMFQRVYEGIKKGTERWNALEVPKGEQYAWDDKSTYIHNPPFFQTMGLKPEALQPIKDAHCLLNLGDSITTDHISPAGKIAKDSPAAKYLMDRGIQPKDFNSYGSRRGNDEIMARGTFANVRLVNKFIGSAAPKTVHVPSGETMSVYDAASKYMAAGTATIILAGAEYGSGSSRDWAAKGPYLQGVKAVIAKSYERIHRSNLVGMGVLPLQFEAGQDAESLGLTGKETFTIDLKDVTVGQEFEVKVSNGKSFKTKSRLDTAVELEYFKHGGILQYVLRKLVAK